MLTVAACGGSGASTTPRFIARANAVCAHANRQVAALSPAAASLRALASLAAAEIPIVRTELAGLVALTAPDAKRATYEAALARTRQSITLTGRLVAAVRARDRGRAASIALRLRTTEAQAKTAMAALGLHSCTRNVVPSG